MIKCSKYLKLMAIAMVMLLILTACGGNDSNNNTNKNAHIEETLGQELSEGVRFKDKIDQVEEKVIETMYGINKDQYTAAKVYMSTGATAEEIAIFRVDSDAEIDAIEDALKMRVEDQKSIMQGYLPDEMTKLDNAIIESADHYVVLCITDDVVNAQKIIDNYF